MADTTEIYREIKRQRAGDAPLRDQLLWRIQALAGADLADAEVRDAFSEAVEAFEPPGFSLELLAERCELAEGDGGSIRIGGLLSAGPLTVGYLQRRLMLGLRYAIHEILFIEPGARGRGINVVSLARCFAFYDSIGLDRVFLRAALATGRWHWARVGFEFVLESDLEAVRAWTARALDALEITDLRIDRYTSTAQFARMGGARRVSLGELAAAMPREKGRIAEVARGNNLDLTDEIELSRALMLTGPEWFGVLELRGPGRAAFDAYAAAKIQRLGRDG